MSLADDVHLLRRSVGLSRPRAAVVRVTGDGAVPALDRLLPCDVWLRDGQVKPTVLLASDGTVEADVLLACDGDDWLLSADGIDPDALIALLGDADVEDLSATHAQLAIDGPFAWALLGAWDEAGAIGLPYLTFYQQDDVRVTRAGRTGEFGYHLLVPTARADALGTELLALGERFGARWVSPAALAYCALENGFLDLPSLGGARLDPRELQLQWRIVRGKHCRGADGLAARASSRRTTAFRSVTEVAVGSRVACEGRDIGEVLVVAPDVGGPGFLGLLLLDRDFAVAGIDAFTVGGMPICTVSIPMVRNRSLYVRPQRHTWADEAALPLPYPR